MTITNLAEQAETLYRAIGRVVVEFQFIEATLAEELAELLQLRDDDDAERIASAMSFRQKVDLNCDIRPKRAPKQAAKLPSPILRAAFYAAEEFRNQIVHSFWYVGGSSERVWMRTKSTLRSRAGLRVTHSAVQPERLEPAIKALYTLRHWYICGPAEIEEATAALKSALTNLTAENEPPDGA